MAPAERDARGHRDIGPRRRKDSAFTSSEHASWNPGLRRVIAEGVGTFGLTTVAAGADIAGQLSGGEVSAVARAIAPGLFVMAFIYATGDISGLHINPSV